MKTGGELVQEAPYSEEQHRLLSRSASGLKMERSARIELAWTGWKPVALPIGQPRKLRLIQLWENLDQFKRLALWYIVSPGEHRSAVNSQNMRQLVHIARRLYSVGLFHHRHFKIKFFFHVAMLGRANRDVNNFF